MYLILAPFLWQQFDAWWCVCLKVSLGKGRAAVAPSDVDHVDVGTRPSRTGSLERGACAA